MTFGPLGFNVDRIKRPWTKQATPQAGQLAVLLYVDLFATMAAVLKASPGAL